MQLQNVESETVAVNCILAGNSRIELDQDGNIKVEAQIHAFEAGLAAANYISTQLHQAPLISIAFDHKGVFRKQFLKEGLTNNQQRNPKLSDLKDEAIVAFQSVAHKYNIPLNHILVIHEDSARTHISHILETVDLSPEIKNRVITDGQQPEIKSSCSTENNKGAKITCAAISSEYFRKAANKAKTDQESDIVLDVYFEDDPWSRVLAYIRGLQLSHSLGTSVGIRLNLVDKTGEVFQGEIVVPSQNITTD